MKKFILKVSFIVLAIVFLIALLSKVEQKSDLSEFFINLFIN